MQRAEHNNGVLLDLQEITLQQQSIEQIELLGRACPNLKILYLQNNLIDSFEGLQRLKVCFGRHTVTIICRILPHALNDAHSYRNWAVEDIFLSNLLHSPGSGVPQCGAEQFDGLS